MKLKSLFLRLLTILFVLLILQFADYARLFYNSGKQIILSNEMESKTSNSALESSLYSYPLTCLSRVYFRKIPYGQTNSRSFNTNAAMYRTFSYGYNIKIESNDGENEIYLYPKDNFLNLEYDNEVIFQSKILGFFPVKQILKLRLKQIPDENKVVFEYNL